MLALLLARCGSCLLCWRNQEGMPASSQQESEAQHGKDNEDLWNGKNEAEGGAHFDVCCFKVEGPCLGNGDDDGEGGRQSTHWSVVSQNQAKWIRRCFLGNVWTFIRNR